MLGGFDPRLQELFVRRNRGGALAWGLLVLTATVIVAWLAYPPKQEEIVEVQLEAEIQDFAVEEEPELEEEPPPPPPPNTKVEVVSKPKPKPRPKPPDKKITEAANESDAEKTVQVGPDAGSPGGNGTTPGKPPKTVEPKPKTVEPKPEPKPKPKAKPAPTLDPTKPIDRPEHATAPKQKSGEPPAYPKALRDEGITGKVVIKLHVHRDGSVRGAKILRKSNNATTDEDKTRADKLFLAAVVAAVKTWTFEPAKLDGQPITVWHQVTVPFTLTAG
jgi:periplasmic protein TonB